VLARYKTINIEIEEQISLTDKELIAKKKLYYVYSVLGVEIQ